MHVRFLRGIFLGVVGFATSGFETLADGAVTDLTPGVFTNGGCRWLATHFIQR